MLHVHIAYVLNISAARCALNMKCKCSGCDFILYINFGAVAPQYDEY